MLTSNQWARRAELFKVDAEHPGHPDLQGLSETQLREAWRNWARKEEMRRLAIPIFQGWTGY